MTPLLILVLVAVLSALAYVSVDVGWREQAPKQVITALTVALVVDLALAVLALVFWGFHQLFWSNASDEPRIPGRVVACLWVFPLPLSIALLA